MATRPKIGASRAALLAVLFLVPGACSTPDYSGPAAQFSATLSDSAAAYDELRRAEQQAEVRGRSAAILAARHAVEIDCEGVLDLSNAVAGGDLENWRSLSDDLAASDCALEHFAFPQPAAAADEGLAVFEVVPLGDGRISPDPIARQSAALVAAIGAYADALAGVAGAKDLAALQASAGNLSQALGGLAAVVAPAAGVPQAAALLEPASGVAGWLGETYLNARRRQVLLRGVGAADAMMARTEERLGELTLALQGSMLQQRLNALDHDINEFYQRTVAAGGPGGDSAANRTRREDLLERIISDYFLLVALKDSRPAQAVQSLRAAHGALLQAIEDDRSLAQAFTELKDFAGRVRALRLRLAGLA